MTLRAVNFAYSSHMECFRDDHDLGIWMAAVRVFWFLLCFVGGLCSSDLYN